MAKLASGGCTATTRNTSNAHSGINVSDPCSGLMYPRKWRQKQCEVGWELHGSGVGATGRKGVLSNPVAKEKRGGIGGGEGRGAETELCSQDHLDI